MLCVSMIQSNLANQIAVKKCWIVIPKESIPKESTAQESTLQESKRSMRTEKYTWKKLKRAGKLQLKSFNAHQSERAHQHSR